MKFGLHAHSATAQVGRVPAARSFTIDGNKLRKAREAVGLSQDGFARAIGRTSGLISKAETAAKWNFFLSLKPRIADALGVGVAEVESVLSPDPNDEEGEAAGQDEVDPAVDFIAAMRQAAAERDMPNPGRINELDGLSLPGLAFVLAKVWAGTGNAQRPALLADARRTAGQPYMKAATGDQNERVSGDPERPGDGK